MSEKMTAILMDWEEISLQLQKQSWFTLDIAPEELAVLIVYRVAPATRFHLFLGGANQGSYTLDKAKEDIAIILQRCKGVVIAVDAYASGMGEDPNDRALLEYRRFVASLYAYTCTSLLAVDSDIRDFLLTRPSRLKIGTIFKREIEFDLEASSNYVENVRKFHSDLFS